jgi:hypothetical protein
MRYEVSKPLLWFRFLGLTLPDGFDALDERRYPVYESLRAQVGDAFQFQGGSLIHLSADGRTSFASMRADHGDTVNASMHDLVVLSEAGLVRPAAAVHIPHVEMPEATFASNFGDVVRTDVSPEYAAMLEETEAFRRRTDDSGAVNVACRDFAARRELGFSILDVELGLPIANFQIDPVAGSLNMAFSTSKLGARANMMLRRMDADYDGRAQHFETSLQDGLLNDILLDLEVHLIPEIKAVVRMGM